MKKYIKLLRVKHYLKNGLVFIPLFFNQTFFSQNFLTVFLGFLSFCMISSSVYIINDIQDVDKDRRHPTKRFRPIASGSVSISNAKAVGTVCFIFSLFMTLLTKSYISVIYILLYFGLNILYSAGFKNRPIVDVVILASGFIIRVVYGATLTHIPISEWLYLTIWTGAFYMGLGKRRNEIEKKNEWGGRNSLSTTILYL